MINTLDNKQWYTLICSIEDGECTPFLGAGINNDILPRGKELASELAKKCSYPFKDSEYDLMRVAQYYAVTHHSMTLPKKETLKLLNEKLKQWKEKIGRVEDFFKSTDEPLGVLASLPFLIYITTNYDNLMIEALKAWGKNPRRELCRWNKYIEQKALSVFELPEGFEPTPDNPLVFHLHGHDEEPRSLVLTEDCYLDFIVNISQKEKKLLPPCIHEALMATSLVFIGYSMTDWDFNVLFRGLASSLPPSQKDLNVSIQLEPTKGSKQQNQCFKEYCVKYFGNKNVQIYWGDAKQFAAELRDRWRKYKNECRTQ